MADEPLEQRVIRDEIRLARDEERLEADERWLRRSWRLELALGAILLLTVAALVIGLIALNRDIDTVAGAAPGAGSVGTAALKDGAVSAPKLADGAVSRRAIAPGAVGGAQVDEASLGTVPKATEATKAASAATAGDATTLGGVAAAQYFRDVSRVSATSQASTLAVKGPITATCPSGSVATGGGASIDGAALVAITANAPEGDHAWVAEAAAMGTPSAPWKLVVTVVCAKGG